ncbi:MAG: terpene cyclase/mutase family protein [Lachnospiraceae bacterium]|nr:terpene cyclase/mutase family protein [Lachnospiraceae bacterium]
MFNFKTISKKVVAVIGAATMAVTLFAGNVYSGASVVNADASAVVVNVTYTAQYDGAFKDVKVNVPVSSDTAENFGYTDEVAVSSGVSMLDVLVQMHKDIFPEYTPANKDEYFAIDASGGVTNAFAKGGSSVGYYKNGAMAWGLSEGIDEGNVVDAFYYQDARWSDVYTSFTNVTSADGYLSGTILYPNGYDPNTYAPIMAPLAGVELGWLNPETLEITPASTWQQVRTNDDGSFSVEVPSTSTKYLLTVLDGTTGTTPLVRTLCIDYPATPKVVTSAKTMDQELATYALAGRFIADNNKKLQYGEDNAEWFLIGLGRAGFPVSDGLYASYYDSVKTYLAGHNNKFSKPTDCAKVVMALNAIGYDPTNIDGLDITAQLNDSNQVNGDNATAYMLLAIESKNYNVAARDAYIKTLVDDAYASGGWGWNGVSADLDTTGIVLAALAPYYNTNASVKAVVDNAVAALSKMQSADGAFASGMDENSNTTAMVVLGLSELGINADTDAKFVKNGISAVDALCSFATDNGGFGWTDNVDDNDLSTCQSYASLGSYFRMNSEMNRLFDMTAESTITALDGSVVLADPNGVLPASSFIEAEEVKSGETYDNANALVKAQYPAASNTAVFEINLFDASLNQLHQLNGKVYVGVLLPFTVSAGHKLVAFRVDGDKLVACDVEYDANENVAMISTDHFSTFVFAEVPEEAVATPAQTVTTVAAKAPKTGDDYVLWISLILVAIGCSAILVAKKKQQ